MSSGDDRWDGVFLNIAQEKRGIEPLFDTIFSFLTRKTDFFSGASNIESCEELVLNSLRNEYNNYLKKKEKDELKKEKKLEKERKKKLKKEKKEKEKKEKELLELNNNNKTTTTTTTTSNNNKNEDVLELGDDGFDISNLPVPPNTESTTKQEEEKGKDEDNDIDNDNEEEEEDNTPPPPGNGGETDTYTWTQTLAEVDILLKTTGRIRGKDVIAEITNKKIKIGLKGAETNLIEGEFFNKIIVEDSFWTIEDGTELQVHLHKANRMEWWKSVVKGDAEIDTSKVVPENSNLADLDRDTRQTVEKMMFDQRQKQMGLPSSDELQKQEMLKKFMSAHPEMDFSNAKIN